MRFKVADQEYEYIAPDQFTLREAIRVKQATGLGYKAFYDGLSGDDPLALAGMVWLCRARALDIVPFENVDFKLADVQFIPEPVAEPDGDAEADPTTPPSETNSTSE